MKTPDANEIARSYGPDALRNAVDEGWGDPMRPPGANGRAAEDEAELAPQPKIMPFDTFDAGDWEGVEVEPRPWTVRNRIPAANRAS